MNKSESIAKLAIALAKFQAEVKNPPNSANNPFFKSKYAPLDVVINTAKELLGKYGLSYIQMPGGDGDKITCVTILMCEGEWIESDILILKADKVTAQGAGSAITYARRYQLSAMLGLAGEEDDDAEGAMTRTKPQQKPIPSPNVPKAQEVTQEQIKRLYTLAGLKGYDDKKIKNMMLKKYNVESAKDLTKVQYEELTKGFESLPSKEETHE